MEIQGLDYNTQREGLIMSEYGREVQQMVEHALSLKTKEEQQRCAEEIVRTMMRITQTGKNNTDRIQVIWNHLAVISGNRLNIDYPVEITLPDRQGSKPDPIPYPATRIPVKHYGKEMFMIFDKLKEMPAGPERTELVRRTANQMKRSLVMFGQGNSDNEKVADDLARFTDGKIQLDLNTFRFDRIDVVPMQQETKKKKKK